MLIILPWVSNSPSLNELGNGKILLSKFPLYLNINLTCKNCVCWGVGKIPIVRAATIFLEGLSFDGDYSWLLYTYSFNPQNNLIRQVLLLSSFYKRRKLSHRELNYRSSSLSRQWSQYQTQAVWFLSLCSWPPLYYIYYILSPEVCGKELVFVGDDYISGQVENQGLGLLKQSYSTDFNKHLFCSGVRINLLPKFIIQL